MVESSSTDAEESNRTHTKKPSIITLPFTVRSFDWMGKKKVTAPTYATESDRQPDSVARSSRSQMT